MSNRFKARSKIVGVAVSGAIVIASGAPGLSVSAAAAHRSSSTEVPPPDGAPDPAGSCVPDPLVDQFYLSPTGTVQKTSQAADDATVYVFEVAGARVNQIEPPEGFRPFEASDKTLSLFGFAPRPSESSALAQWQKTYANFVVHRTTDTPAMCQNVTEHYGVHDEYSFWSGMRFNGSAFTHSHVHGTFQQPTPQACSTGSDHGYWAGIGGVNYTYANGYSAVRLMQAGTRSHGAVSSAQDMWFEAIIGDPGNTGLQPYPNGPLGDTGIVQSAGKVAHPGDTVVLDVYIKNGNTLVFNVNDTTTGVVYSVSSTGFWNQPGSAFWDGATQEWTEETANGILRKQAASTWWYDMQVDGSYPGDPNSWYTVRDINTDSGDAFGNVREDPELYGWQSATFQNTWKRC